MDKTMKQANNADAAIALTPLASMSAINSDHSLKELPMIGKVNIRGSADNADFIAGIQAVLQIGLPLTANTVSPCLNGSAFWLGPDEWLIHVPLSETEALITELRKALADTHASVCDVSDYSTVIELSGEQARSILASGSPFDVRAALFKPGQCAQTRFTHASILLWPLNDGNGFGIQVRWSFAEYLFTYLAQSLSNAEALST